MGEVLWNLEYVLQLQEAVLPNDVISCELIRADCCRKTVHQLLTLDGRYNGFRRMCNSWTMGWFKGEKWVYMPQGSIEKIILQHGNYVYSIKFQTNGECQSSFFGDNVIRTGCKVTTISIDHPNEYLMSISGTIGDVVTSICFMTNLNLYGPYGTNIGTAFSYDVKDEVIVGFHGCASDFVNAIGVYTMPKSPAPRLISTYEAKVKNELCGSMSRMTLPRDAGPWGGYGGKPWDDGVFSTIKQVHVHLGALNVIYGLQVEYLKSDGEFVLSQIHGGNNRFLYFNTRLQ